MEGIHRAAECGQLTHNLCGVVFDHRSHTVALDSKCTANLRDTRAVRMWTVTELEEPESRLLYAARQYLRFGWPILLLFLQVSASTCIHLKPRFTFLVFLGWSSAVDHRFGP
ncbi:uncharacterized protein TM35_000311930 [Trypanosoma theileri]|uniref:Uncharacterized protein n=1 Tax=Trypanosoma theileri TaxID=67003 RepID=A0A1X0NMU2_9TRYP|nr:uncharacterized protein TM35_000311930 [Trypanosoma theileri]ORC86007.1 hypothetical protein TM35_000311930 [Trypanosoma theileri]